MLARVVPRGVPETPEIEIEKQKWWGHTVPLVPLVPAVLQTEKQKSPSGGVPLVPLVPEILSKKERTAKQKPADGERVYFESFVYPRTVFFSMPPSPRLVTTMAASVVSEKFHAMPEKTVPLRWLNGKRFWFGSMLGMSNAFARLRMT